MTDKKQPKTEEEIRADLKVENTKKFLAECDEFFTEMRKKYKLQLVPVIQYTEQGAFPVFGKQEVKDDEEATQESK